jgi:hypothetical protein
MPPKGSPMTSSSHGELLSLLGARLRAADLAEIVASGRGPMRRLNRDEYEQNLRDLLQLPQLDIRDLLPADREAHHFNKVSDTLDMSRVQLMAYLDACDGTLAHALSRPGRGPAHQRHRPLGA